MNCKSSQVIQDLYQFIIKSTNLLITESEAIDKSEVISIIDTILEDRANNLTESSEQ